MIQTNPKCDMDNRITEDSNQDIYDKHDINKTIFLK